MEVEGLSVVYRNSVKAVDGISLEINRGELFTLVGPNGAGKTTLMKVLTTLLKPTSGRAYVCGYDVVGEASQVRKRIGYVPQNLSADDELTGMENMMLQCRLYGISGREAVNRSRQLLEVVGLLDAADRVVSSYSGGMRRRLEIAMGLVHTPEVLFMDEPTLGLDVQSRLMIWDYIRTLRKQEDVTIIFTTHYMEEADKMSERVGIIDHGKIVALGSPDELKRRIGGDIIALEAEGGVEETLKSLSFVENITFINGEYRVKVINGEENLPRLLNTLHENGAKVRKVTLIKPSLDQVFVEFTGRAYREEEPPDYLMQTYIRSSRRR